MQITTLHCDPLICRSVPHMRAGAHKIEVALGSGHDLPATALALGIQLAEMLGNGVLRSRCQAQAKSQAPRTTKDLDLLLLGLCIEADDPAALAPYMARRDHAGAYAAIRRGYAAIRQHDIPALLEVIDRLANDTGVHAKLMCLRTERLLMIVAKEWLETKNVNREMLANEMRSLPGHLCQGLVLDALHLFSGYTFGDAGS